eukprot:COSAG02_NODE_1884_length_10516_cov_4.173466_7_plen_70_part_00
MIEHYSVSARTERVCRPRTRASHGIGHKALCPIITSTHIAMCTADELRRDAAYMYAPAVGQLADLHWRY